MKKLNIEEFIYRSNIIHNYKYDYSLVQYVNMDTKVKILYNNVIYEQAPKSHLLGRCPEKKSIMKNISDYDIDKNIIIKNQYNGLNTKLEIQCLICNYNYVAIARNVLLNKSGCPNCNNIDKLKRGTSNTNEFISKCINKKLNEDYIFDKVNYINNKTKIIITCIKHGDFLIRPNDFLCNKGCPKCKWKRSKGEEEIAKILDKYNINYIEQYQFDDCFYKKKLKFDFYLVDKNICIEYDGVQHYKETTIFEPLIEIKNRDNIKNIFCLNNKITLIRFSYKDFSNIDVVLKNILI